MIVEYNIENEEGILSTENQILFEIKKKGKLKIKIKSCSKLLYEMSKSPQYNQKRESKQCKSEIEEICIYLNLESGCHSIKVYLKINSGFHARKNPKEQYLKVVTFIDA